jgi:hypothetical protein
MNRAPAIAALATLLLLGAAAYIVMGTMRDEQPGPEPSAREAPVHEAYLTGITGGPGPQSFQKRGQALVRLQDLKEKMAGDGVDFTAVMANLRQRLNRAPGGKISPEDVIGVVPREYAADLTDILNELLHEPPPNTKENQP